MTDAERWWSEQQRAQTSCSYEGQQAASQKEWDARLLALYRAAWREPLPESLPLDAPRWMLDIWGAV